jgi:hypothetical protein
MKQIDNWAGWLKLREACELARTSRSTMLEFIKARAFKSVNLTVPGKKFGRWRVEEKSLTEFMNKQAYEQATKGGKRDETSRA